MNASNMKDRGQNKWGGVNLGETLMHEEENFKNNKTTNVINPFIFLEIHYESRVECNIKKGTFRGSPPPLPKILKIW